MESKLKAEEFTQIFLDSLPLILINLPNKAFYHCINDFTKPFITEREQECLYQYSQKYLYSIDQTLINFSKKILE